jgi:hypothetical protein
MTKLFKTLGILVFILACVTSVKAQLPPGIVPYNGIPRLVPATLSDFNTMNYCRLTTGVHMSPTTSTSCSPIPIPGTQNTISNPASNSALTIFSTRSQDNNTCWGTDNSVKLYTFPSTSNFTGWDTTTYGVPKVLRMGNTSPLAGDMSNNNGMTASYYFIPNEEQNLLVFWFSFVATNPNHSLSENPFFRVEVTDVNGSFINTNPMYSTFYINPKGTSSNENPCAQDIVSTGDQLTCFNTFPQGVFWANWIRVAFNLADYEGQVVRLRVLVSECVYDFHRAYCYFTGFGTKAALDIQACGDDNIVFEAPVGFTSYRWYVNNIEDASLVNIRKFTRLRNTNETLFRCDMISRTGAPSSITSTINYYDILTNFTWEQKFDECDNKVQFTNTSEIYKINNGGNVPQPVQYVYWDFGDGQTSTEISPIHYYDGTGPYNVTLKVWDADSICDASSNAGEPIVVTLSPSEIMTTTDTVSTCEEKLPYLYTDPLMAPSDVYSWTVPGNYTVTYPMAAWNGCDSVVDVTLDIKKPAVRIEQHQDYCETFSTELIAIPNNENVTYLWNTEETTPSIIVTTHGTYDVTIRDENDCTAKSFIKIAACEPPIYIPTAITPSDKNGLNDCIELYAANLIQSIEFTIFNRFGQIVYKTYDPNFKWCGEVYGDLPINTIYQYVLVIVDQRGIETMKKGTITVL